MVFKDILSIIYNLSFWPVFWSFLRAWWWVFPPIILFFSFRFLYKYWIQWEMWYAGNKWILLKIVPPKETTNTFKAMEDVYNILFGIHDDPNWREYWCEGEFDGGPFWLSWEIVSIGGRIHFYVRCLEPMRALIQDTLYSHFPEIEISLVEDYTKKVPQDVPNAQWDLYSEDYTLVNEQARPIKTYPIFFEEKPEAGTIEDIRIDPIDSMLEAMSKLNPDEQLWFQMVTAPVLPGNATFDLMSEGKALINKIVQRPEEKKGSKLSVVVEAFRDLAFGPEEEEEEKDVNDWLSAPELRMTSGEKATVQAIERKISKQKFKTWMRIVYLYKRDKPFFKGNYKIIRSYFNHFAHSTWNSLVFWGSTRTRIHWWNQSRRLYLRKRINFRNYVRRLPSMWPRNMDGEPMFEKGLVSRTPGIRGTASFNSEELATIYHFPAKISSVVAPAILPIAAKKAGPPIGLPTSPQIKKEEKK